jgi:hypothetical protein
MKKEIQDSPDKQIESIKAFLMDRKHVRPLHEWFDEKGMENSDLMGSFQRKILFWLKDGPE